MRVRIDTAGLDCLLIRLFEQIDESNMDWLLSADLRLREVFGSQLIDLLPSYTSMLLHYDLQQLDDDAARALAMQALQQLQPQPAATGREHRLPVWYDPQVGPDLAAVARHCGLDTAALVSAHSQREYRVFALGFAPGFAYLGLLEQRLAMPRLATPRRRVPAGSVAIAERQTAIYPCASPGGWQLLGRMPLRLFDPSSGSLLQPGDRVRFVSIDHAEFIRLGGDDTVMEASA